MPRCDKKTRGKTCEFESLCGFFVYENMTICLFSQQSNSEPAFSVYYILRCFFYSFWSKNPKKVYWYHIYGISFISRIWQWAYISFLPFVWLFFHFFFWSNELFSLKLCDSICIVNEYKCLSIQKKLFLWHIEKLTLSVYIKCIAFYIMNNFVEHYIIYAQFSNPALFASL